MKKYLYGALALPLLFACSSEEFEKEVVSNDQFAGIEKVDATFSFDEGVTRMDDGTGWTLANGDKYGFAWLGDGTVIDPSVNGNAYQNHPLTQTNGIFKPETSIYVGKYYIYRPYDYETVDIGEINFNSLANQTLTEGQTGEPWKKLAETSIIIGDKWTDIVAGGRTYGTDPTIWDEPGIEKRYKVFAAFFSNQSGLDVKYKKNNEKFDGKSIAGATDISYTYPAGSTIGAADITKVEATLAGQANSFTYAPTAEPNTGDHDGDFWASQKNLNTTITGAGFTWNAGAITLNAPDADGVSTGANGSTAWFWFNSLPNTAGTATLNDNVTAKFYTSYGDVTVNEQLKNCAYVYDKYDGTSPWEWIKLVTTADNPSSSPKEWNFGSHNTFVNHYGNHKGKYVLTVDFKNSDMSVMHIKNDAHLQKALKFYIASGKTEAVTLNLDPAGTGDNNVFKISKISIALIQTIQNAGHNVKVQLCGTHSDVDTKLIVTQDGQDAIGLAAKKEVPALNNVFAAATKVYLSSDCEWTWAGGDGDDPLPIDVNVTSIINEGTLTVNATNVELSVGGKTLENTGTMNITKVTTVKNALTNKGTINVGAADNTSAELRAYGIVIDNEATALGVSGTINNYGVIGVTAGTSGKFNNYGLIDMQSNDAITLLSSNATGANAFGAAWADDNKMGTVNLPANNPTALVSVSNATNTGFIKYIWPAGNTTYTTPVGNVKYNTIVVSNDITFTAEEVEIKYIEFNGIRTQVVNPLASDKLTQLKGIIVNGGKSIIIEMNNVINVQVAAHLGEGATIYKGGKFRKAGVDFTTSGQTTNYLGPWSLDQIIEY